MLKYHEIQNSQCHLPQNAEAHFAVLV